VFYFRAPPEYAQILTDGAIEVVTLANNHSYDYGDQGYADTQNALTERGVEYFAYNETLVREVNGIKFGFFGLAFDSDPDRIHALMDQLYNQGAEIIIAYNHDGWERDYSPDSAQIDGARTAIDYGASAVFFSHPHVLQGIEEYNGGFIAYSMGNFCFGGNSNPSDKDTMIVQLEFTRTSEGFDRSYTIIPCSLSSASGYNDYQPTVLEGDERQRVMDKILGMSYL
ncbi:MAG: CapA family protein, partial [Coriobacteriales bacterium]|jgi:poly-gamma-glutamate synthesis protein (capsule biosynthesis protein)|nr:CapA family protein [Coriobacteriales bacterium]